MTITDFLQQAWNAKAGDVLERDEKRWRVTWRLQEGDRVLVGLEFEPRDPNASDRVLPG